MNIEVKKTRDLSVIEKQQIVDLFNHVFSKNLSAEIFFGKYYWTTLEGSYHSIMKINGTVVGCYSVIPYNYNFFHRQLIFGLSVDTMIHERFRGNPYNLKKMAVAIYEKLIQDGVSFVFGFPNDNIFVVRKKILKWKDVGLLDIYILPIRLGKLTANLRYLNFFSRAIALLLVFFTNATPSKLNHNSGSHINMIDNSSEYFIGKRYANNYAIIRDDVGYFSYTIMSEAGAVVVYILEIFPLSQSRLEHAVNQLYKNLPNADAIIYVGNLNFRPRNMIKVPQRYSPKLVRMSGLVINDSEVDERVFDISNWQVSLANFDVR